MDQIDMEIQDVENSLKEIRYNKESRPLYQSDFPLKNKVSPPIINASISSSNEKGKSKENK